MVRNINGGSKTKSRARKDAVVTTSREIRLPTDELEFIAYVTKACGDGRFDVTLTNGEKISCIVRGKHKGKGKRNSLVVVGSLILVGLREWENPHKNSDLICIYSPYEIESIRRMPHISLMHFPNETSDYDNDIFSNDCYEEPTPVAKQNVVVETEEKEEIINFDEI